MSEIQSAVVSTSQRELDAMIAYARRWLPYDGGPGDDILVTFGVPAWTFYGRLAQILDHDELTAAWALTARESAALRKMCRARSADRRLRR